MEATSDGSRSHILARGGKYKAVGSCLKVVKGLFVFKQKRKRFYRNGAQEAEFGVFIKGTERKYVNF